MSDSFSPIPPIVPLVTTQTRLLLAQPVNPLHCRHFTKTFQYSKILYIIYYTVTRQFKYKYNTIITHKNTHHLKSLLYEATFVIEVLLLW